MQINRLPSDPFLSSIKSCLFLYIYVIYIYIFYILKFGSIKCSVCHTEITSLESNCGKTRNLFSMYMCLSSPLNYDCFFFHLYSNCPLNYLFINLSIYYSYYLPMHSYWVIIEFKLLLIAQHYI